MLCIIVTSYYVNVDSVVFSRLERKKYRIFWEWMASLYYVVGLLVVLWYGRQRIKSRTSVVYHTTIIQLLRLHYNRAKTVLYFHYKFPVSLQPVNQLVDLLVYSQPDWSNRHLEWNSEPHGEKVLLSYHITTSSSQISDRIPFKISIYNHAGPTMSHGICLLRQSLHW